MGTNFYDLTALNFRNTIYALNMAVETHFTNLILSNDGSRIIYSDNSNSLRKRAAGQAWNNLYLPFMNYSVKKVTHPSPERPWFNHGMNISGVWIEELQRKIRYTPIRVSYESTFFIHRSDDMHYAMMEMIFDDSNETLLRPEITIDGQTVQLLAVLGYNYNLDFEPDYVQKDWFEKNRIHSIGLNFEFDYMYIKDKSTGFGIPDEVILNWGRIFYDDTNNIDEIYNFMINRYSETVTATN